MNCKAYQKMMFYPIGSLTEKDREKFKRHLEACPQCAELQKGIILIKEGLAGDDSPSLPEELDDKVRMLCYSRLEKRNNRLKSRLRLPIPNFVWTGLGFITILTTIWFFHVLQNFNLEEMNSQTWTVLTIIFQNTVMLLFAPVLIRKIKPGNMNSAISAMS